MDSPHADRYLQAKNYYPGRNKPISLVAIHTMEYPERSGAAQWCAEYFAGGSVVASSHYCLDDATVIQGVREADTAFTTPGCNSSSISLEHAGRAAQSPSDWEDTYSSAMLTRSAKLVADICTRHGIPMRHLTDDELRAGQKGIIGHDQATRVFRKSTHTDPGSNFPWSRYISMVRAAAEPTPAPVVTPAPAPKPKPTPVKPAPRVLRLTRPAMTGPDVKALQVGLRLTADGAYGPKTEAAVKRWQKSKGLSADGVVGPATRRALAKHKINI